MLKFTVCLYLMVDYFIKLQMHNKKKSSNKFLSFSFLPVISENKELCIHKLMSNRIMLVIQCM